MNDLDHSFGQRTDDNPTGECVTCGDGRRGAQCVHRRYSMKERRFLQAHSEELLTAFYNPDKQASSNIRSRLAREYRSLPSRHACWCVCPNVARGRASCDQCNELQRNQKLQEPAAMGRTAAVHAPMPDAVMLDLLAGLV
jgi:hypothetical protein